MKKRKCKQDQLKIQAVYDKHGGTRASARLCGYSPELLSIWKRRGAIPLKKVAEMANKLKCSPFDLNAEEVSKLVEAIDAWEEKTSF